MGQLLLLLVVALTVAAIVFGVTVLVSGTDPGLAPTEPDGRAVPLPANRPLAEEDVSRLRFDTAVRGYRMAQVDQALRRAAYDIGYKDELIGVLQAEVSALREGRTTEAEALRRAREAALASAAGRPGTAAPPEPGSKLPAVADEPGRRDGDSAEPPARPYLTGGRDVTSGGPGGPSAPGGRTVPVVDGADPATIRPGADPTESGAGADPTATDPTVAGSAAVDFRPAAPGASTAGRGERSGEVSADRR